VISRSFRPSSGVWFLQTFDVECQRYATWIGSDKPTPADFDGDGITDVAVWHSAPQSNFLILQSSSDTVRVEDFGVTGDDPALAGDWDGDGKADPAVYRSGGQSFIFFRGSLNNPNSQYHIQFRGAPQATRRSAAISMEMARWTRLCSVHPISTGTS
jgi:hypothetical protein